MDTYESIIDLISANPDTTEFGEYGQNYISDLWIDKVQVRLKVKLPILYIWWLKNYGGGEIFGDEVFSIYNIDFSDVPSGDIVYINELNRKNGFSNDTQLIIQENDQGESFYFDLSEMNDEYPVFRQSQDNKEKYADNFLEFLKRRILDEH